ncbi:heavy metal translocating P-type ATPase [Devosia sp. YIM 151766]|uniref:heavy metal translocating P-type ATPase n=1 Tax=Devosia sp. YIM 151766 TaxID=3017325 RepID=UPI00255C4E7C|nr:heavy metal translocating P-type ATPase [Devosia sp. YIM 151766]WIY52374.1 heavy metal translocating P-type ATPase [Devosia sp. YIM 151766]
MTCCAPPPAFVDALAGGPDRGPSDNEVRLASRDLGTGLRQSEFSAPAIHCGACIRTLEAALDALPGIVSSRVNLSSKRVTVRWRSADSVPPMVRRMVELGYEPNLFSLEEAGKDGHLAALIRALAVAAFCSMNIMMLSGSVWSGADGATSGLLHWICAILTLPALLYSGRVFYQSAWSAIRSGRTNMDVPITIGIALAFALSFYDTVFSGDRVYYDAVASLIFFLLIGRTLDHAMRERARTAVKGLARLAPAGALVLDGPDGPAFHPLADIAPGSTISVAQGERIPLDGTVLQGISALDRSLLTGESLAEAIGPGQPVPAGALNLSAPLLVRTTASERDSTLNRLVQLLDDAETSRNRYRRIADRAAAYYSPIVHLAAALAFIGWMIFSGNLHDATTVAIAVLIITCPCALGLAVPMVQVMAARRLFEAGIMVKDGSALERLAEVDVVVFDKTGTLTTGLAVPRISHGDKQAVEIGAGLAALSAHPYSIAIARAFPASPRPDWRDVAEHPGLGIEARLGKHLYRLGRPGWSGPAEDAEAGSILSRDGAIIAAFQFEDDLRPNAVPGVNSLLTDCRQVLVLSGDRPGQVQKLADRLGIAGSGGLLPQEKLDRIGQLAAAGHQVLMVGDGLNDTPAMARAHVSMAPASAVDIGRSAADFVFLRNDLLTIPQALAIAREARELVRQNLILALLYNVIALPIAVAGLVNPFLAAVAMSASSIVVVLNALRLGWHPFGGRKTLSQREVTA